MTVAVRNPSTANKLLFGELDRGWLLTVTGSREGIGRRSSGVKANIAFAMLNHLMDVTCQHCDGGKA